MDPSLEKVDIEFLVKTIVAICDKIPGSVVQNIAGHTFKIMRQYMIDAGIFSTVDQA